VALCPNSERYRPYRLNPGQYQRPVKKTREDMEEE
jgi:hypothetical protein